MRDFQPEVLNSKVQTWKIIGCKVYGKRKSYLPLHILNPIHLLHMLNEFNKKETAIPDFTKTDLPIIPRTETNNKINKRVKQKGKKRTNHVVKIILTHNVLPTTREQQTQIPILRIHNCTK